jgi:hypothetical protein
VTVSQRRLIGARIVVLLLVLSACVMAACLALVADFGHPDWWALPALAAAVAGSELAVVHFPIGRQRWTLSCTDALLTLVFVVRPGSWMVLMVPAGVAVAQLVRRQRADRIVFNVAQFAAATAAGACVAQVATHASLPRLTAAALATTAFWLVQTPFVAAVVSVTSGTRFRSMLAGNATLAFVHTAASASVGLLAGWLALTAPVGLLGLLVPVVLLWSSFDQNSQRAAEARLYAELARGQEQAGGGSVDVSAQVVLTAAARLLGGAAVEMLVFAPEGLVRYEGDDQRVPKQSRVGVDALDRPWVTEALAGGVVTGSFDGRSYCAIRIGPASRPRALLCATRTVSRGTLGRHDAKMLRVLIGQAESWLSVADLAAARDAAVDRAAAADHNARALGDLGAGTIPALSVLRESSGRLARLAQRGADPGDVAGIVDELHTVERAVASLLGAIALAADTDLNMCDVELPPPPGGYVRQAEWTSSGTLS